MSKEKEIVVDFSGWLKLRPETARFQNAETQEIITGDDYIKLSDDDREDYVLDSVISGLRDCFDSSWESIEIIIQDA